MNTIDHAANLLKINRDVLQEALHRGRIQAQREAARSGDGAVSYQPETPQGGMFQSIRDGFVSAKILHLGK